MTVFKTTITSWLNQHLLFFLSLFLLIFIPLYPKIPLFEAIPGYLVRVRLEDILVLLTGVVWFVQFLRQKIEWRTSFHFLIIAYAAAGLLSLLVATYLQQTIPLQFIHLSKSLLHYFRYLEYFSLFFFMYAGIKTKRHTQIALIAVVTTLNLIFLYGLGQRYLEWPAFSTMNREFSKGQALVLAPDIKLHSTFGGHYDLAAYLVIILPLVSAWLLRTKKHWLQLWLGLSIGGGLWLLLESASKTALIAAVMAVAGVAWLSVYQRWGLIKSSLITLSLGLILGTLVLGGLWFLRRPTLYQLAPFLRPAGYQVPVDVTPTLDETWSANARKYGLSMGIRLDTLWPNALMGFSLNPYTGKGYATLNKKGVNEFTEADSTDNNLLRVLGETGLLGLITFGGIIILIINTISLKLPTDDLTQTLSVGFIAATVGLLINSFIIDVFSASKVAFTYWGLAGLVIKSYTLAHPKIVRQREVIRYKRTLSWLKKSWPILIASIFLILLVHKRPFTEYSLVKSFALNATQAKYVATPKCWLKTDSFTSCITKYQPKLGLIYSLYLLPFLWIYSEPAMFYFANLILIIASAILLDKLIKKFTANSLFKFLLLSIIFTTPSFYALPTKSSPANLWLFLILLIANKLLSKIKTHPIPKLLNLFMIATAIVHLGLVQYFVGLTTTILANFRDTYRPVAYRAIRRANRYLPSRASQHQTQPILLTDVKPILFDLYGQDDYQIKPIEVESNQLDAYQQLISHHPDQELFITNANADEDFEQYKQQFGIRLKEIDCRQECNYYQLLAEEVQIPTQPQTLNHRPLAPQLKSPKFVVLDDQAVTDIGAGLRLSQTGKLLKQELIAQHPDLIFITGDIKNEVIKHYGQSFINRLKPELNLPIITVYQDQYQVFAVGESWYISLDATSHHTNPQQNVFLYDTLLQLEKHPQIKHVYFISHDNQWLQPHPDNYYFWQDFPKTLEKFKDVKFEYWFKIDLNNKLD